MLNLVLTTDKLQLVTSSAATIDVHASFADLSGSTVTPGKQNTATSSATTTDIVASPAGSTVRNVKTLHIRNKDASLSCDVTVVYDQNGTDYELHKATLQTGQMLEYIEGIGFFLIQSTAKLDQALYVTADDTSHVQGAAWGNVTGLQCPVVSGSNYVFDCFLIHQTNATTTGAQFGIGGVAMTGMIVAGLGEITTSITAATYGSSAAITAVDTAFVVETTGPGAVNMFARFSGWFQPSASGTFSIRAQCEQVASATMTIKKGSWAIVRQTDN